SLFRLDWTPVHAAAQTPVVTGWAVLGAGRPEAAVGLQKAGIPVACYPDIAALRAAVAAGAAAPQLVLVEAGAPYGDEPDAARLAAEIRSTVHQVLELVQDWLAEARFAGSRLVLATRGAVAVGPGPGISDLPRSAVWGLVRSAQAAHPGRFVLADLDAGLDAGLDDPSTARGLAAALAATGEDQLALRGGGVYAPRLVRVQVEEEDRAPVLNPAGTVLITGGTGLPGSLAPRHLSRRPGVAPPVAPS